MVSSGSYAGANVCVNDSDHSGKVRLQEVEVEFRVKVCKINK